MGKGVVDAGVQMQALTSKMGAATGSAQIAAASMRFVREEAERLGLDFRSSADGFASFAASALRSGLTFQETKDIFTGVSEAAAGMRLSAERTALVFQALSQMASKGTVSMEELKQQLGESLPGALQVFAKAMGVSNDQFIKMIENGQVTTRDLIKLGQGLKNEFGAAAEEAAKGAQAAFNRFGNALFDLKNKIAEGGFLDSVTDGVKKLTDLLNDPQTRDGLIAFASGLGQIATAAMSAASAVGRFFQTSDDRAAAMLELAKEGKSATPDAVADKVNTIQLRRDAINAPFNAAAYGITPAQQAGSPSYTLGKTSNPGISAAATRAAEARERMRQQLQSQSAGLINETDVNKVDSAKATAALNKRYEEEQALLEKALAKKAITDQEFKEESLKVELDYQARMAEIRQQYRDEMLSEEQAAAEGFLGIRTDLQDRTSAEQGSSFRQAISQAAEHNRAFFMLEKAAALARALLAARQTVVDAYRWGNTLGGPVGGAVAAGVAAAAQAVNIAAIASTSFGGGGGGVSSSGGGGGGGIGDNGSSSDGGNVGAAQNKSITVHLTGADLTLLSKNQIRQLFERLNDAGADGSQLTFVSA